MKKTPGNIIKFITEKGCLVKTPEHEIQSIHTKLVITCKCGSDFVQSYRDFRQQRKFQCVKCTHEQNGIRRRNTHDEIANYVKSKQCLLLSQYENVHAKMHLKCRCGNEYYQSLSDFKSIHRNNRPNVCPDCAKDRRILNQTFTFSEVKQFIDQTGCKLLSTEYSSYTDKLKIRCRQCDNIFTNTLKDFKNNGTYACATCTSNNYSIKEKQVVDFIRGLDIHLIENDRTILAGKELDIVLPDHNLAIEFDGVYFHSEQFGKSRNYHLTKTQQCESKNIQLLHIFEHEWNCPRRQKIWKSIIKTKTGKNSINKIYARNCTIRLLDSDTKNEFLHNNHLQGPDRSTYAYGLFYQNELVFVMTFSTPRFNKKYDYEIVRLCSKLNTLVVGGASKTLNHFIKNHQPKTLISYADRRFSAGKIYQTLRFTHSHNSPPSYMYTKQNRVYNRMKFQKHKLRLLLETFDVTLSETQNMKNHGYSRIWDCGNSVWIYEVKK